LIATDLPFGNGVTPVSVAMMKLATSLGQSFEAGKLSLALPRPPDQSALAELGDGVRRVAFIRISSHVDPCDV